MPTFPPNDFSDLVGLGRSVLGGGLGLGETQYSQVPGDGPNRANAIVRTPRQASTTFDLGGAQAIRPKGAFYVRFVRADNSGGIAYWEKDHGFLVKRVDQPTVTPKVEEIHQYNRKRQIITGYQSSPVSIQLYDTADAMVARMWRDYASYHYGDFNQTRDAYSYDMVPLGDDAMLGSSTGYGFTPKMDKQNLSGDTQFFFSAVEIYQVYRNAYTLTTLVNPKIISYDAEELDYSTFDPVMISIQLAYEAVIYNNGGAPQKIEGELGTIFKDIRLHGDVIDLPAGIPGVDVTTTPPTPANILSPVSAADHGFLPPGPGAVENRSGLGGVLGAFGNFNFGSAVGQAIGGIISGRTDNLASEIIHSATGNRQLATLVNMATSGQSTGSIAQQFLYGAMQSGGISPSLMDTAAGVIAAANGDRLAAGAMAERLINGILVSSSRTGQGLETQATNQDGVRLSQDAIDSVNATRDSTSQIGHRGP